MLSPTVRPGGAGACASCALQGCGEPHRSPRHAGATHAQRPGPPEPRDVRLNAGDVDEVHAARCRLLQHDVLRRGMAGAETRRSQSPGICPNARHAISKAVTDSRPTWPMSIGPPRPEVPCRALAHSSPQEFDDGPFPGNCDHLPSAGTPVRSGRGLPAGNPSKHQA